MKNFLSAIRNNESYFRNYFQVSGGFKGKIARNMKFHLIEGGDLFLLVVRVSQVVEEELSWIRQGPGSLENFSQKKLSKLHPISSDADFDRNLWELVENQRKNYPDKVEFLFHGIEKAAHFLGTAKLEKTAKLVFEPCVYDLEEAKELFPAISKDRILKYPRVSFPKPLDPSLEEVEPLEEKPKPFENLQNYEYKGIFFEYTRELQNGFAGKKGADHKIPIGMLQKAIEKSHKKIKKKIEESKTYQRLDYYFYDEKNDRILFVIFDHYPKQHSDGWVVKVQTAYFVAQVVLDERRLSGPGFEKWKKTQISKV